MDSQVIVTLLGRIEPFRGIDEATRQRLAQGLSVRVCDRGEVIYWQDEPGEAMFVLLEGSVKFYIIPVRW